MSEAQFQSLFEGYFSQELSTFRPDQLLKGVQWSDSRQGVAQAHASRNVDGSINATLQLESGAVVSARLGFHQGRWVTLEAQEPYYLIPERRREAPPNIGIIDGPVYGGTSNIDYNETGGWNFKFFGIALAVMVIVGILVLIAIV